MTYVEGGPLTVQIGDQVLEQAEGEEFRDYWGRCVAAAGELQRSPEWLEHYRDFAWKGRVMGNLEMHALGCAMQDDVVLAMRHFLASFDSFFERNLVDDNSTTNSTGTSDERTG